MSDKLLKDLNPKQKQAVTATDGPVLIVAGAGTGKTTVITKKIVYLLTKKLAKPEEIVALTFTNKASQEMQDRVEDELPLGYYDLWLSTFHSFAERILKADGLEIGLPTDFKLFNSTDSYLLLRENLDKFNLDYYSPRGNPAKFIQSLVSHFSRLKDENIKPEVYLDFAESLSEDKDDKLTGDNDKNRVKELAGAYHTYQNLLLEFGALDFGDLILYCLELFQQRPNILKKYQTQFKYILVDEFQDTNWAQHQLVKLLAKPQNNLTVVGDDNQSIYRFRGAAMSNIMNFRRDYKQAETVVLTDNYRSGQEVLNASYNFIQNNNPNTLEARLDISKKLKAQARIKSTLKVLSAIDLEDEARQVVESIKQILQKDKTASLNDIAILSRTNASLERFTQNLTTANIPFVWLASTGLYQKKVILDTLAYLRLLDSYHESSALWRVLNLPIFGITSDTLQKLTYWARRKAWSLFTVLGRASVLHIEPEQVEKINQFLSLIAKHTQLVRENKLVEAFLGFWRDSGLLKYLESLGEAEANEQFRYLNQFYKKLKDFTLADEIPGQRTLSDFLFRIDNEQAAGDAGSLEVDIEAGPEAVRLMTVHKAKGLEFKYVFLVNLVNQVFPSRSRRDAIEVPLKLTKEIKAESDNLEEERRLFYVACTRAKKNLYLSWAEDHGGLRSRKASIFLSESGLDIPKIKGEPETTVSAPTKQAESRPEPIVLPKTFSFSQIKSYRDCPLQYKYGYIYKIPTEGSFALSFGITMHTVLQKALERFIDGTGGQTDLFGQAQTAKPSLDWVELKEIYKNLWIDDWYESQKQMERDKKRGLKALREFYNLHKDNWPKIKFLERGFKLQVSGVPIMGRVDRVDEVPGGIEIVDYKTGQVPKILSPDDKRQLLLYQLVAEEAWGLKPVNLSYYYLMANEKVSFLGQDKDLEKLKQEIRAATDKIKQADFTPTPSKFVCSWCNFKNICDYRAV